MVSVMQASQLAKCMILIHFQWIILTTTDNVGLICFQDFLQCPCKRLCLCFMSFMDSHLKRLTILSVIISLSTHCLSTVLCSISFLGASIMLFALKNNCSRCIYGWLCLCLLHLSVLQSSIYCFTHRVLLLKNPLCYTGSLTLPSSRAAEFQTHHQYPAHCHFQRCCKNLLFNLARAPNTFYFILTPIFGQNSSVWCNRVLYPGWTTWYT